MTATRSEMPPLLSLVIPVFNGSRTIAALVEEIDGCLSGVVSYEIVLVDDGSTDESAVTCAALVDAHPNTVRLVQLTRNFGEHNAVLVGLRHARGDYVCVLDDDGQNPPREVLRLLEAIRTSGQDVVYGCYRTKHHSWWRNFGSRVNNWIATLLLQKPPGLYLSSFKIMNRFVVDRITGYRGGRPYIDALIYQVTRAIDQIEVAHRDSMRGRSNYTLLRALGVWIDMVLSSSIVPLRLASALGFLCFALSGPLLIVIAIDKLWLNPTLTVGIPTLLATVVFFAGVQLLLLGLLGEYLGRLFQDHSGAPQSMIRHVREGKPQHG